jgi:hypothetical protein
MTTEKQGVVMPVGWEELKAFLHKPDVTSPYGPFLDIAIESR